METKSLTLIKTKWFKLNFEFHRYPSKNEERYFTYMEFGNWMDTYFYPYNGIQVNTKDAYDAMLKAIPNFKFFSYSDFYKKLKSSCLVSGHKIQIIYGGKYNPDYITIEYNQWAQKRMEELNKLADIDTDKKN